MRKCDDLGRSVIDLTLYLNSLSGCHSGLVTCTFNNQTDIGKVSIILSKNKTKSDVALNTIEDKSYRQNKFAFWPKLPVQTSHRSVVMLLVSGVDGCGFESWLCNFGPVFPRFQSAPIFFSHKKAHTVHLY